MPPRRTNTRPPETSQVSSALTGPIAPPTQLVFVAEGLLPAKHDEAGEQAQIEPAVEPIGGVDAVVLERRTEVLDGVLFRLRHPGPIDGEVPRELVAAGAFPWIGPVDERRATVGGGTDVAELPVAVHEREWRLAN